MKTFTLPDLGEGLQDAEIVAWHVSEGARVVADQPLVSVETQKAVVEVPAPWSGTVAKLHAEPGETVDVGAPLAEFDTEGEGEDTGSVVGTLKSAAPKADRSAPSRSAGSNDNQEPTARAAPAVRKIAAELGVDLSTVTGTGPDGAITRRDVEAAGGGPTGDYEPLRGVRRAMARNMARANAEIAATTVTDEARIGHWGEGSDATMRLVRAIAAACRAEPSLNAWFDGRREARLVHERVDLGIATNTEDGLFVPVMRDVGNRDEADLRAGLEAMKADIRARTIPPGELTGQTITLSNFGMIGGRHAALVVMPPQVAIVGSGRITAEPRIVEGRVEACRVMPLSLSFDHRAVTGAEATRFLAALIADLES